MVPIGYLHHLVSELQHDVDVILPMSAGKVNFEFQSPVTIVNASVLPVGIRASNGTYIKWEAYADSIKSV